MHNIAVIIGNGNKWSIPFTTPARYSEDQCAIIRRDERKATKNWRDVLDQKILEIEARACDDDGFEGSSGFSVLSDCMLFYL